MPSLPMESAQISAAAIMEVRLNSQRAARRGRRRRRTPEAPCADCIERASLSNSKGDVRFCNDCARKLGQVVRPQPDLKPTVNDRPRGIARRLDYRRTATTNRHAAAVRHAQSLSPVATSNDHQFVAVSEAHGAVKQASVPFTAVDNQVANISYTPTEAFAIPITEDNENIEPPSGRQTKSPPSRRSDARSARERLIPLPRAFVSLGEAHAVLQPVHDGLASLVLSIESSTSAVMTSFSQDAYRVKASMWLSSWEEAFARHLQGSISSMTEDQRRAARTLKAYHLIAECFATVQPSETALDWSGSSTKFQAVLDLADNVMRGVQVQHDNTSSPCRQSGRRDNSIDSFQTTLPQITIQDPVHEVQLRTTNVTLRDQATQLLSLIRPRQFTTSSSDSSDPLHVHGNQVSLMPPAR